MGILTVNVLENLIKIEKKSVGDSKILSQNFKKELNKTDYEFDLPPELEIQENVRKYWKEGKKYRIHLHQEVLQLHKNQKKEIKFMMRKKKNICKQQ